MTKDRLYLAAVGTSFALSWVLTPAVRALAVRMNWLDKPSTGIKTHTQPTPVLGGVAIWCAFAAALVSLRFLTNFPTGTLFRLRAVLAGGGVAFLLGVIDDFYKPHGLDYRVKFAVQFLAAAMLVVFGIRLRFITPDYLAVLLTLVWVVGITNAFNIIDIMDGLAASQAAVAALAFLLIALPSEEVYVNFTAAVLLGSVLGFLPWNFSRSRKIFMGDGGSLFIGFILAAMSLGTNYSRKSPFAVYAPLFILMVPIFDVAYVMAMRMMKGQSPFLGSKDHFALRLEALGHTRPGIVALSAAVSGLLSLLAFVSTSVSSEWTLVIYAGVAAAVCFVARHISQVKMS
jgi:UDP-GlcNAc:undecaprenyl-phosphate GlcNAc-1-phosphate transferase